MKNHKNSLWDLTKNDSGLTKEEYDLYFSDTETAYAYELSNVVKFAVLKLLSDYGVDQAPQSFVYVNNGEE